ncbi:unnamed protein product [Blepharisma stoltei]|uniref:Uncharacterized protein n=1 Tax=Blepharisma stoltei TaxID=1481888 RepID=A0AAU9IVC2_9CILI|nr:unnamed protein product [Blepharisma stoltei]
MKKVLIAGGALAGLAGAIAIISKKLLKKDILKQAGELQVQTSEFKDGVLTLESAISILDVLVEQIPDAIGKIKEEFVKRRLEFYNNDEIRYRDVVKEFLALQEQEIKRITECAFESFQITAADWDKALSKYFSHPEIASRISKLHPKNDASSRIDDIPVELTEEKYIDCLREIREGLAKFAESHQGELISPFELIVTELKIYDDIWIKYGFNEIHLSSAKHMFRTSYRVKELQQDLEEIHKSIMPPIKVKAA